MAFLSDPYQRQQLALMLAGGTSGMGGVPRLAGWSAPIGAFGRGLAQTMPYMMQMQQYQQEQQQQQAHQQAMSQALQTTMHGLPGTATNPYLTAAQGMAQTDPEVALKMMQAGLGYTPPATKRDLQTITQGNQEEQGYFDEAGNWVKVGGGPRFAPQQGPAPPEKLRILSAMGIDPKSPQGQKFLMGEGGGYAGTSTDATDLNNIRRGMTDPAFRNTPDYALSYNQIYQKPQWRMVQTDQGTIMQPTMPTIPQGVLPPGSVPAPDSGAPAAAAPAQQPVGTPQPIIVGQPKPTQAQERAKFLSTASSEDYANASRGFDKLSSIYNRAAGEIPYGDYVQTDEYRQVKTSIEAIAATYTTAQARSGTGGEVSFERNLSLIMPTIRDGPGERAAKKARLDSWWQALQGMSGNRAADPPPGFELDQ